MNQKHIGIAGTSEGGAKYFEQRLRELAGENSPKISTAFADFEVMQRAERGNMVSTTLGLMRSPIKKLLSDGADFVVIPSFSISANPTYSMLEKNFKEQLPFNMMRISIEEAQKKGVKKPGLMGPGHTIQGKPLMDAFKDAGMAPVTPGEEDQRMLDALIYETLAKGESLSYETRFKVRGIVETLKQQQADGVIIACSDLSRISAVISSPNTVDSTKLMAQKTLEHARQKE